MSAQFSKQQTSLNSFDKDLSLAGGDVVLEEIIRVLKRDGGLSLENLRLNLGSLGQHLTRKQLLTKIQHLIFINHSDGHVMFLRGGLWFWLGAIKKW